MENISTLDRFDGIMAACLGLFSKKTKDYGTSWRILRLPSITDQIFIKAKRIRQIQESGQQKVSDSVRDEFLGIINYCIVAIMQNDLEQSNEGLDVRDKVEAWYIEEVKEIRSLLAAKNHDYGEAWRDMRISSITDLILQKLIRIKSIEDNEGEVLASEGVVAGYQDIVNYSVFSLILLGDMIYKDPDEI